MTSSTRTQAPLLLSLALIAAGVIIAAAGGLTSGSVLGGIVAALGAVPACYATWLGMQKDTQASLGLALLLLFASLGAGAILVLLRVVDWLR
ncbi:MAG TPA: hypothetical protein VEL05_07365 [Candidatus Acidoferrum sp.]|nr:hypothetical protein [Candidatus Acidoferrum sp.]